MDRFKNYLANLTPRNEPAIVRSWSVGALTALLGFLTLHHVIPVGISASPDVKTFLPLVAGALVGIVGHLIRPAVTPVEKYLGPTGTAEVESIVGSMSTPPITSVGGGGGGGGAPVPPGP